MFSALLNIVLPVFGVVGLGALYGRLRPGAALGYVNRANIELFTPALVFSALVKYPLALAEHMPLIAAGALVILLPGLLLALLKLKGIERAALILPAMCNLPLRMKNRELVKTSGRWRDKLRNGGACSVIRLNQAVCSGQLNPDTWLGRSSAFAGGIPSLY